MASLSLLIIEDDINLQVELCQFLENFFTKIDAISNAEEALKLYNQTSYDLVLTDIELPNENGLNFIQKIKKINPNQLVIVMSAYKETKYFLKSIELQIYSFLVKPFDSQQLIETFIKVTKILEKAKKEIQEDTSPLLKLSKNLQFDTQNNYLYKQGSMVMLTQKEEKLLEVLVQNLQSHVSEAQIKKAIWDDEEIADSTLRVLIKRLREKLGYEDAIINLKGRGYKLNKQSL
jgi:two-component system, OmpR family, response regulator CiaR